MTCAELSGWGGGKHQEGDAMAVAAQARRFRLRRQKLPAKLAALRT